MASFARSLQTFRDSYISCDDLLVEVDQILANDHTDATWMLATLSAEHAKSPLPADVCSALRGKLLPLAQKESDAVNAGKGESSIPPQNAERTQLETDDQPDAPHNPDTDNDDDTADAIRASDDIDLIKSTGDILNNRFDLQECVGSGGMSAVYKAVDRRKIEADDRHPYVAVKVLNLEFRAHPNSLMALQREAKKCQGLAHPNIVRVYDFDRDGATIYMTMEYLSGVSLGHKMRAPGFTGIPREEALRIINNAGEALRFAHDSGIVHADFKPANVLITDDGEIKVIDFGIARAFQHDETVDMEVTRFDPGTLQALTPTYASPEMLEQQMPHPRDDIYALACTAYEMLTGFHPFKRLPATTARDAGIKLQRHKALTYCQFIALKHALEFEPGKRTATIDRFLKELNQTAGVIRKGATAIGLIGFFLVAVAVGYRYLAGSVENIATDITPRDSQSTANAPAETDLLVSSAPSVDRTEPNGPNGAIEQSWPPTRQSTADLELMYDIAFWETIKNSELATEYQAYLESFPNGRFASEAVQRVERLTQTEKKPQLQPMSKIEATRANSEVGAELEAPTQSITDLESQDLPRVADQKPVSGQAGDINQLTLPVRPQPVNADAKRASKGKYAQLLASAEAHFNADRLMAPKFHNALFIYVKILRLDAENADALAGIEKIKAKLMAFAADAQAQNDMETARSQLMKVLIIDPQNVAARAALAKLR